VWQRVPNALAHETSPYLRQHSDNPVDWLPWGETALRRAREENKPLLVSIGYSACHWCHVMERESFEDAEVADVMNQHFVCVKVDREERPDVDAIYMEAIQAMTGQGGWPLNVFCTPGQVPFYGGTYYPPQQRFGLPSWRQVLDAVADAWTRESERIIETSDQVRARLAGAAALTPSDAPFDAAAVDQAVENLRALYDPQWGGFGTNGPKFPPSSAIELLLARSEHEMALETLRKMARGGIHDQVGGGFARYAVDRTWTVPHFEKMLYDNALLARAYLHGWLVSGDDELREVCARTLDWTLREMRGPEGMFYSALDADSEGVEGKFYVWTVHELIAALGPDAEAAIDWFGASDEGNFEGSNVLEAWGPAPDEETRERIRSRLLELRAQRVWPGLDDKRLTSWNALMIGALAEAGAVLDREDYVHAARSCALAVLRVHRDSDGRLLRTSDGEHAKLNAYLEDHAFLVEALLTLYESTFEPAWFAEARALADTMIARFGDPEYGGFFSTSDDHETLVARRKDLEDSPIPAGNSSAALGLLRLAALTGEASYEEHAHGVLRLLHEVAPRHPTAFGHLLQALDWAVGRPREVALVGPRLDDLERVVRSRLRPRLVLAGGPGPDDRVPLLAGREPLDGRSAAYVCEHFACQRPVSEPDELAALLD
jgi:uncharacterized protein